MADKLTKEVLADQRKRLKIRLWRERTAENGSPDCAYCGAGIFAAHDCVMHEWLIRRGRLPIKTQFKIMHEYNCVLLHVDCHAQHETTRECKLRCAKAQYKRYGRYTIVEWVQSLGLRQHVEVPTEEETC